MLTLVAAVMLAWANQVAGSLEPQIPKTGMSLARRQALISSPIGVDGGLDVNGQSSAAMRCQLAVASS